MKKIKMTQEGYEQVKKELLKLYQETRPKIIEDLRIAYDFGDLRENSEFDAARDAQNLCDQRIKKLENMLNNAWIVDEIRKDVVDLGSKVTVEYLEDKERETFWIVSSLEVSSSAHKISDESPMGKALCGRKINEIIEVVSPAGTYQVKIIAIQ